MGSDHQAERAGPEGERAGCWLGPFCSFPKTDIDVAYIASLVSFPEIYTTVHSLKEGRYARKDRNRDMAHALSCLALAARQVDFVDSAGHRNKAWRLKTTESVDRTAGFGHGQPNSSACAPGPQAKPSIKSEATF